MPILTISIDDDQLHRLEAVAQQRGLTVEELAARVLREGCADSVDDEASVRALYPGMAKVFGPAGWDDPDMDAYNVLDPRKAP